MERARLAVTAAQYAALAKHGPLTMDPVRACAILLREGGEAMNEALLASKPVVAAIDYTLAIGRMYDELAQVAATAMTIMDYIKGDE